jgi:hypothetical protein
MIVFADYAQGGHHGRKNKEDVGLALVGTS